MSIMGLLGVLFIGLKLANIIAWSWWLVLLPLYAIPALTALLVTVALVRKEG